MYVWENILKKVNFKIHFYCKTKLFFEIMDIKRDSCIIYRNQREYLYNMFKIFKKNFPLIKKNMQKKNVIVNYYSKLSYFYNARVFTFSLIL